MTATTTMTATCRDCGDVFTNGEIAKFLRRVTVPTVGWICHDCRILAIRGRAADGVAGGDIRDTNL
jgi:hypothetical protein